MLLDMLHKWFESGWRWVRAHMRALFDLVWPGTCMACGDLGQHLCAACVCETQKRLRAPIIRREVVGVPVVAATDFSGPVRHMISAFKDQQAVAVRPWLTALSARALTVAWQSLTGPVSDSLPPILVPVPSSPAAFRRRGRFPLGEVAARLSCAGLVYLPALQHVRPVQEQSGLSAAERSKNMSEALVVRGKYAEQLWQRQIIVMDDVVTTGATMAAAIVALQPFACEVIGVAMSATAEKLVSP